MPTPISLVRGQSMLRETSLASVLDHGYYSSRLQLAAPITGWGQLARLPNEIIQATLERCTMGTLLNIMLVNRGALDFVLQLPDFDRVLATLLVHIKAIKCIPSALEHFFPIMKGWTYAFLKVTTLTRSCRSCGCDLVNIPGRPFPGSVVLCAECCTEPGHVPALQSSTYRRVMAMPPFRGRP
ncbi:hypothetical protein F4679DRAFT_588478 [Xylaria curta]|nr:hypothetical protein F4679DRAFT_588478 [Xylaria curta]